MQRQTPPTCELLPEPAWLSWGAALLVVALAAVHLYVPPARAAELEVIPDSVEYAVAARQFATTGKYQIHVNGQALPPRYPPGFSVLFLAPIYAVAAGEIGNGIFAVWVAGIAATLFAFLIGRRLAGVWGATAAAVLFLHHWQIVSYTQVIMTDVPAVALGLICCWIYLRIAGQTSPSARWYFATGVAAALAVSIRPLSGVLLLPFLIDIVARSDRRHWLLLMALLLPSAGVILGTSLQQVHAFGDWRRTGYQFWLAVPYDYINLTFSPRYLKDNLGLLRWNLVWAPAAFGAIATLLLWRSRSIALAPTLRFLLLGVVPLSLIHLFYFFTDIRFHFLFLSVALILAGAGVATAIPQRVRLRLRPLLSLLLLSLLLPRIPEHPLQEGPSVRHQVATAAAQTLPPDAILISRVDPAYLEEMVTRGTRRKIVPLDRATPYATAVLTARRIPAPAPLPRNAADHACPGLLNGGAQKLYPATADEEIGDIRRWIRAGVPVYLELLSTGADLPARVAMAREFHYAPVSSKLSWLVRLEAN